MNIRQFLSNYFIVCVLFTVTPLILWLGYAFSSEGTILKYNVGIEKIKDDENAEIVV